MSDEIWYWEEYKVGDVTVLEPVPACWMNYTPLTRKELQDTIDAYMRPTNCCGKS
jgi:hypothetical protein